MYFSSPWIWAPGRFNRPPAEFSSCIVSLTGLKVDGLQGVQCLRSGTKKGKKVNDNLPFILLTQSHPLAYFRLLFFFLFLFYSHAVFFVSSISYFSCLNCPHPVFYWQLHSSFFSSSGAQMSNWFNFGRQPTKTCSSRHLLIQEQQWLSLVSALRESSADWVRGR